MSSLAKYEVNVITTKDYHILKNKKKNEELEAFKDIVRLKKIFKKIQIFINQ